MKIRIEVTKSRSSYWPTFARVAKHYPSYKKQIEHGAEMHSLEFDNVHDFAAIYEKIGSWKSVCVYQDGRLLIREEARELVSVAQHDAQRGLIEAGAARGALKESMLWKAGNAIAARLRLPIEHILMDDWNGIPNGPGLFVSILYDFTPDEPVDLHSFQIDAFSRDETARRRRSEIGSAVRALPKDIGLRERPLTILDKVISTGAEAKDADLSGLEGAGMTRFCWRIEMIPETQIIDAELERPVQKFPAP